MSVVAQAEELIQMLARHDLEIDALAISDTAVISVACRRKMPVVATQKYDENSFDPRIAYAASEGSSGG